MMDFVHRHKKMDFVHQEEFKSSTHKVINNNRKVAKVSCSLFLICYCHWLGARAVAGFVYCTGVLFLKWFSVFSTDSSCVFLFFAG